MLFEQRCYFIDLILLNEHSTKYSQAKTMGMKMNILITHNAISTVSEMCYYLTSK